MSYQSTILAESSLVSYYKLDEAGGSTSASDSKGSRTLSAAGTGAITFGVTGIAGTAATFSGSNDLTGSNSGLPTGTGPVSLEAWFNTTSSPSAWNDMCGWGDAATSNACWLGIRSDGVTVYVTCYNTTVSFANPAALTDGRWHHLAATYDGTTMRLYLDGAQVASSAFTLNLTSGIYPFTIGMGYPGNGKFTGTIDEVAVYSAALSASDILSHYTLIRYGTGTGGRVSGDGTALSFGTTFAALDSGATSAFFSVWLNSGSSWAASYPFLFSKGAFNGTGWAVTGGSSTTDDHLTLSTFNSGTVRDQLAATVLNSGGWVHYAAYVDSGGVYRGYKNGSLALSGTGADFNLAASSNALLVSPTSILALAEPAIYKNPSTAQADLLATNLAAGRAPQALVPGPSFYCQFGSGGTETDLIGSLTATVPSLAAAVLGPTVDPASMPGTAAGTSTAVAQAAMIATATGVATASGVSAATGMATANAAGTSTATGVSGAVANSPGTADGLATATGVGLSGMTATATGVAVAAGAGLSASGAGADGLAAATATGLALSTSVGAANAGATAVGAAIVPGVAAASGLATATATGVGYVAGDRPKSATTALWIVLDAGRYATPIPVRATTGLEVRLRPALKTNVVAARATTGFEFGDEDTVLHLSQFQIFAYTEYNFGHRNRADYYASHNATASTTFLLVPGARDVSAPSVAVSAATALDLGDFASSHATHAWVALAMSGVTFRPGAGALPRARAPQVVATTTLILGVRAAEGSEHHRTAATTFSLGTRAAEGSEHHRTAATAMALGVSPRQVGREIHVSATTGFGLALDEENPPFVFADAAPTGLKWHVIASAATSGTPGETGLVFIHLATASVWLPWRQLSATLPGGGQLPH